MIQPSLRPGDTGGVQGCGEGGRADGRTGELLPLNGAWCARLRFGPIRPPESNLMCSAEFWNHTGFKF